MHPWAQALSGNAEVETTESGSALGAAWGCTLITLLGLASSRPLPKRASHQIIATAASGAWSGEIRLHDV